MTPAELIAEIGHVADQKRLATLLGVTPNAVYRWQQGQRVPRPAVLARLRALAALVPVIRAVAAGTIPPPQEDPMYPDDPLKDNRFPCPNCWWPAAIEATTEAAADGSAVTTYEPCVACGFDPHADPASLAATEDGHARAYAMAYGWTD